VVVGGFEPPTTSL